MKESDLASHVVDWLENQHWDVYQEVRMFGYAGKTIDIVAVRAGVYWAIECKTSLSLTVLGQANEHRRFHRRSVAIPQQRSRRLSTGQTFALQVAEKYGIGILRVGDYEVREQVKAPLCRRARSCIETVKKHLFEEQKYYRKAGSTEGHTWTPYQKTMRALYRLIAEKPGITLKEIMAGLEHHYATDASARQCIPNALETWGKEWCRVDRDGKVRKYYIRKREDGS